MDWVVIILIFLIILGLILPMISRIGYSDRVFSEIFNHDKTLKVIVHEDGRAIEFVYYAGGTPFDVLGKRTYVDIPWYEKKMTEKNLGRQFIVDRSFFEACNTIRLVEDAQRRATVFRKRKVASPSI